MSGFSLGSVGSAAGLDNRCNPLHGFASSMKQVSGVKAKIDRDAAAPRLSFKYRFVL